MDRFRGIIEDNAYETYYGLKFTTPNALYKLVEQFVTNDPKEGKEIKDPGNKVDNEFGECIIEPGKQAK